MPASNNTTFAKKTRNSFSKHRTIYSEEDYDTCSSKRWTEEFEPLNNDFSDSDNEDAAITTSNTHMNKTVGSNGITAVGDVEDITSDTKFKPLCIISLLILLFTFCRFRKFIENYMNGGDTVYSFLPFAAAIISVILPIAIVWAFCYWNFLYQNLESLSTRSIVIGVPVGVLVLMGANFLCWYCIVNKYLIGNGHRWAIRAAKPESDSPGRFDEFFSGIKTTSGKNVEPQILKWFGLSHEKTFSPKKLIKNLLTTPKALVGVESGYQMVDMAERIESD